MGSEMCIRDSFRLERDPPDPWIANIRNYLRVHFASPLTLSTIASRFEMTPSAFVKKFSRLAGQTPMKELRLLRLVEARRMIVTTNHPLKIVASAVGIGDEYQLSKLFRLHFGVPPREMRSRSRMLPLLIPNLPPGGRGSCGGQDFAVLAAVFARRHAFHFLEMVVESR